MSEQAQKANQGGVTAHRGQPSTAGSGSDNSYLDSLFRGRRAKEEGSGRTLNSPRALGRMCLEPPVLRTLNEQGAVVPASGSESSRRRSVCPPPEGNALLVGRRAYNSSRRDLLGIRGDGPSLGDFASMYEA